MEKTFISMEQLMDNLGVQTITAHPWTKITTGENGEEIKEIRHYAKDENNMLIKGVFFSKNYDPTNKDVGVYLSEEGVPNIFTRTPAAATYNR